VRCRALCYAAAAWFAALLLSASVVGSAQGAARPVLSVHLTSVSLRQGEATWMTITASPPDVQVTVQFAGRAWPVYRTGAGWRTAIGVDALARSGRYPLTVEAVGRGGARAHVAREIQVLRVPFAKREITFSPEVQALLTPEAIATERERVREALKHLYPEQLWQGALARPVEGRVSSPYGVLSVSQGQVRGFHTGTDIAAAEGTPVAAAAAGIVRLAELLPLSGNAVFVDHGIGVVTSYLHLSQIDARVGQRVARGEIIGRVGSTGLSTGPHLHWGLRVNGVRIDPLPWTNP
jgi:murein DD-endopeptidase MepM/ murein hydrolase activator NlpD